MRNKSEKNKDKKDHKVILPLDWLVRFFAMKYLHAYADMDDLMQYGRIGILKAEKRFDPSRNIQFKNYASWWIRGYIRYGWFKSRTIIRQPERFSKLIEMMGIDMILEDGYTLKDTIVDHKNFIHELEQKMDASRAVDLLTSLSLIERNMLKCRSGIGVDCPMSLSEIGYRYKISKQRVKQIEGNAIRKMKQAISIEKFKNKPLNPMHEAFYKN